ncbi:class I lanthipeptide [Hymenobacter lucidus]|uniref:Class I lanthipeptide n=1 Tax=Hymenobacter lucidus TaxID=2880930 RepID=A0ABS8AVF5_9BACT|nr:class I lanthipeptide [Hymenobacter lucidus]MCB2409841.1 class I lanthipeptide [Hymenobacter lucidus]
MKKQNSNKLAFSKEKIANLSAAELGQIIGGQQDGERISTYHDFTCGLCTDVHVEIKDKP